MRNRKSRGRDGIALLEVLIALVVMGLGLTAALKAIGTCTRGESRAAKQAVAARLATRQMAVFRGQGAQLENGEQRGGFASPQDRYSWEAMIEPPAEEFPFTLVRLAIFAEEEPRYPVLVTQSLL